jgi:hypothetical protein
MQMAESTPPDQNCSAAAPGNFDAFHIYHDYDLDPSLREEPITYYKRQTFLDMVQQQAQEKDTKIVLAVTILIAIAAAVAPLPAFGLEGSYSFLGTVFQGFSGMLGLLAVALVYRLEHMKAFQKEALDELKQFLVGRGIAAQSYSALELWKKATDDLAKEAKKKKAKVHPGFIEYLNVRINYCTRLQFEVSHLQSQSFATVIPFILLLVSSLVGLALAAVAPAAYVRFGLCLVVSTVWLSILVILRCVNLMRRHFWVRLGKTVGEPGMELPPDTFPV